ncbi:hypothetical protein BJ546DRAFT_201399 [Cryomyces antarcticus]
MLSCDSGGSWNQGVLFPRSCIDGSFDNNALIKLIVPGVSRRLFDELSYGLGSLWLLGYVRRSSAYCRRRRTITKWACGEEMLRSNLWGPRYNRGSVATNVAAAGDVARAENYMQPGDSLGHTRNWWTGLATTLSYCAITLLAIGRQPSRVESSRVESRRVGRRKRR